MFTHSPMFSIESENTRIILSKEQRFTTRVAVCVHPMITVNYTEGLVTGVFGKGIIRPVSKMTNRCTLTGDV